MKDNLDLHFIRIANFLYRLHFNEKWQFLILMLYAKIDAWVTAHPNTKNERIKSLLCGIKPVTL